MGLLSSLLAAAITLSFALSCLCDDAGANPSKDGYGAPNTIYYNTQSTTPGSTLLKNLKVVLGNLAENNSSPFSMYGSYPDIVYGFYKCYTPGNCSQCFNKITDDFAKFCPLAVGARQYVVNSSYSCFLRYENYNFFPDFNIAPSLPPQPVPASPTSVNVVTGNSHRTKVILGVAVPSVTLLLAAAALAICAVSRRQKRGKASQGDLEENLDVPRAYRYEELRAAAEGFPDHNRLGQGGFGTVYKAVLQDGREVAVKKLQLESNRGKDEFVNEVKIISSIQHRNLVRLEGYCVEASHRLLVLEYVANGSLDKALFDKKNALDWPTRRSIIVGIAQGLAYLHEESHIQIIHRDIKASNVLLDTNFKPRIADFGISKLYDRDASFTATTEVAGTYGYLAPEYAIGRRLTPKIDVFSFGVLVLEIISGRKCNDPLSPEDQELLLEWVKPSLAHSMSEVQTTTLQAWNLHLNNLLEDLIDPRLGASCESSKSEVLKAINIALLCTQAEAVKRPSMSLVVAMLLNYLDVLALPEQPPTYMAWLRQMRLGIGTVTGGNSPQTMSILEPR